MPDFPDFAYSPLVTRLSHYGGIDKKELEFFDELPFSETRYQKGDRVLERGDNVDKVIVVTSGWAARSSYTKNGNRQIIHILLAGDIVTPDVFVLKHIDHEIEALSTLTVRHLNMSDLTGLFAKAPTLSTALWWASAQEDSLVREHVVQLGRRNSLQRVAHFILELHRRLVSVDQATEEAMILPITQNVISDALGLTFVTVSRNLKLLTQEGFVAKNNTVLQLLDAEGLSSFCDFDTVYFHLQQDKNAQEL